MKRYLAFFGSVYYPSGGMKDFEQEFDDLQPAIEFLTAKSVEQYPYEPWRFQWAHVYDCAAHLIVWRDGAAV